MDQDYQPFCLTNPSFYDAIHFTDKAQASFPTASLPLPSGWRMQAQDDWLTISPENDRKLPTQGWKIHASATVHNAEQILQFVWNYCLEREIRFRFLRSASAFSARLSKYSPRAYSGQLVTIYPADDVVCETLLHELGEELDGQPSPYILSDLRWGRGPLYVRYGAFTNKYTVDENGDVVKAIENAYGELVPDRRDPVFQVPQWVTLPDFLKPHLAARDAVRVADSPYTIERVLHFSSGGGIYVGRDPSTGAEVVLKEGRPHTAVDATGDDAVRRLGREYDVLRRLAGIPGIPAVHGLFWLGEHRFLVMEHVEGDLLGNAIARRSPLLDPTAGPEAFAEFTDWATDIHRQTEAMLTAMHQRGLVYGDLNLFNVMVRPDDTVALLDFEVTKPVRQATRSKPGDPGFAAPRGMTGFDIDRYALACLQLALFLPMTNLLGLHRSKAKHYAEIITDHFPVPQDFLAKSINVIVPPGTPPVPSPRIEPDQDQWPRLREDLTRAIVASATPKRDDRLFPGDIQQFAQGGIGLAHGAAGVLYALSATGAGRYQHFEQWLLRRAMNPTGSARLGLYDGLHGAAFTLDHLGYRQEALDTLDLCLAEKWETLGSDLFSGLAGIGLNLFHMADRTGESALRAPAQRAAEIVAERLGDDDGSTVDDQEPVCGGGQSHAGLFRGRAGPALLLLRAYDDTGDVGFLDRAAVALRQDLRRCVIRHDGALEVAEGRRTLPYLDGGSVGIGLVLDEYLASRHDEQFIEAVHGIELSAHSPLHTLPGLFTGRAGILLFLAGRSSLPVIDDHVAEQVRRLAWHALPYADGVAFPGTALLRLSMDLATGTAGVLLALGSVLHDEPVHLPLLSPTRTPRASAGRLADW